MSPNSRKLPAGRWSLCYTGSGREGVSRRNQSSSLCGETGYWLLSVSVSTQKQVYWIDAQEVDGNTRQGDCDPDQGVQGVAIQRNGHQEDSTQAEHHGGVLVSLI
ncbi:hypothetical protein CCH79_00014401 [Gambusia affinis]|uniref:Uncharacterized protein n=1 Tax=Gambusia affinis TaxID=33528 RepID=A0A315V1A8_GAMAF|nr:hypothetical protein CCH79_00014401 [Gambusia affinis]